MLFSRFRAVRVPSLICNQVLNYLRSRSRPIALVLCSLLAGPSAPIGYQPIFIPPTSFKINSSFCENWVQKETPPYIFYIHIYPRDLADYLVFLLLYRSPSLYAISPILFPDLRTLSFCSALRSFHIVSAYVFSFVRPWSYLRIITLPHTL